MGDAAKAVVDPIVGTIGPIAGVIQDEREHQRLKENRREQRDALDDLSYRREATYRNSRMALQGAIEDFYRQKGWAIPERLPGAFTARGLPGEQALYPGVSLEMPKLSDKEGEETEGGEAQRIADKVDIEGAPKEMERPTNFNLKSAELDQGVRDMGEPKNIPRLEIVRGAQPASNASALDAESLLYIPDRKYAATREILPLLSRAVKA